ncbi:MAG: hypothetical protein K2F95_08360 [Alistipes sp.]|nr:hypothetical protein [Alistipes sp.]
MANNLWILTEERPKKEVLRAIFEIFAREYRCAFSVDTLKIIPILNAAGQFQFTYRVEGYTCDKADNVYLKIISGSSSFTDFLIFYQEQVPAHTDKPIFAIEETKTDDSESRNTGVYQRCSKFVYIRKFYADIKMIMLYNLQVAQKHTPTQTNIFGTKLLRTLGVEIHGKTGYDSSIFAPFQSIDEIIEHKSAMRRAPRGNVPITIRRSGSSKIEVSGRLYKNGSLSHDPNIGALSIICAVLRHLGWKGEIEITAHGLSQGHLSSGNKFIRIAEMLDISFQGLIRPAAAATDTYWHYDLKGEKLATIFMHIAVENFTDGRSIFENHAGCEKGYFITSHGQHIALEKYNDRAAYKAGNKDQIINIPDLILIDCNRCEIIDIEGKKHMRRHHGIEELAGYDCIEAKYISKHYPDFDITRTVIVYGSTNKHIVEPQIGFMLNKHGDMILGKYAPEIFRDAITRLLDFWSNN